MSYKVTDLNNFSFQEGDYVFVIPEQEENKLKYCRFVDTQQKSKERYEIYHSSIPIPLDLNIDKINRLVQGLIGFKIIHIQDESKEVKKIKNRVISNYPNALIFRVQL